MATKRHKKHKKEYFKETEMKRTLMNQLEVREVFKRELACKELDQSMLECIADAVGMVIEENNRRILDAFASTKRERSTHTPWKM